MLVNLHEEPEKPWQLLSEYVSRTCPAESTALKQKSHCDVQYNEAGLKLVAHNVCKLCTACESTGNCTWPSLNSKSQCKLPSLFAAFTLRPAIRFSMHD
jgi:hypothetical protein